MIRTVSLVFIFWAAFLTVHAQNYKLRTVVIYSFTRYIQWPDAYNTGIFEIQVLGETPLLDELNYMAQAKKAPGGRPIKVTQINDLAEIKKCNILIVPAAQSSHLTEILQKIGNQAILVVTEEPGLGAKGSDINFLDKEGKLAFELNQSSVNKKSLKVSTEISRLAILI